MTVQDDIQKVLDEYPDLSYVGVGFHGDHGETRDEFFNHYRQMLLDNAEEFRKTCEWLSTKKKIKTINTSWSSYGLKHEAEWDIGYISNGVFIAAAIHCGFKIKRFGLSPNVCINISREDLKGYRRGG